MLECQEVASLSENCITQRLTSPLLLRLEILRLIQSASHKNMCVRKSTRHYVIGVHCVH